MHRFLAIFIATIAVIQCYGIGERIIHASWQWYKFYGYSNDGYTTLSVGMTIFTFAASIITLIWGLSIYENSSDKFTLLTIKYSSYSLAFWSFLLALLVMSPLGQIVQR